MLKRGHTSLQYLEIPFSTRLNIQQPAILFTQHNQFLFAQQQKQLQSEQGQNQAKPEMKSFFNAEEMKTVNSRKEQERGQRQREL